MDDDFDWEDGVIIGGFFDYMTEQEEEVERRRKKLERKLNPDNSDRDDEDDDVFQANWQITGGFNGCPVLFLPFLFGQMLRLIDGFFHAMATQKANSCQKKSFVIDACEII